LQRIKDNRAVLENVERALKKAILHRKNAMFYQTLNGARVDDVFMSLIHTAELNAVAPFEYLVALQRHEEEVCDSRTRRPALTRRLPRMWRSARAREVSNASQPAQISRQCCAQVVRFPVTDRMCEFSAFLCIK
jgi:hypothetical protein